MTKASAAISNNPKQTLSSTDSQIIDQTIQTKLTDQFRPYYLISGMLFLFTILEWYRWFENYPPVPLIMSGLFIISLVIAFIKQRQFRQELGFLNFGKQGEKPFSEYLQNISTTSNVRIFKNVVINENIYKCVMCTKFGLMLIDVIEIAPPENGEANVEYKNNKLTLNGYPMDRDPVKDIKKSRSILQTYLEQSSNKKLPVHCVLVFPNWYVRHYDNSEVKIINPRQLLALFNSLEKNMTSEDQYLASYHLNKYIRIKT